MRGAPQIIRVSGTIPGDLVAWTTTEDCTYGTMDDHVEGAPPVNLPYQLDIGAGTLKTVTYELPGTSGFSDVEIHTAYKGPSFVDLNADVFTMCYKPLGGLWTRMIPWDEAVGGISRNLIVVDRPLFSPVQGIAGSATNIIFTGDVIDNDLVVLNIVNCNGAHLVRTGIYNLGKTPIINKQFSTSPRQVKGSDLKVCVATFESQGLSEDDYTELLNAFSQVAPPDFEPFRMFQGSFPSILKS